MRWMISYRFKHDQGGDGCSDAVCITDMHPCEFVKSINGIEGYEVTRLYSAVEVPKRFRNTNIETD